MKKIFSNFIVGMNKTVFVFATAAVCALGTVSCGGVSRAGDILVDTTKKYFLEYAFHACRTTQFALATLGNDAGIYGGACSIITK